MVADGPVGQIAHWLDGEVAAGRLAADSAQRQAAIAFDRLLKRFGTPRPRRRLLGLIPVGAAPTVRGLYVWGGVGRGKTLLMDRFHEVAPVGRKRRQHFHAFMADMHEAIATARRAMAAGDQRDPVEIVARSLANEVELLCFDEFSVTDIADAMLLGRLFGRLFDLGLTLVATSNVAPDRLYWNGLNRQSFLPFVGILKEHCEIVHLRDGVDHRLEGLSAADVYLSPLGAATDAAAERLWLDLSAGGEAGCDLRVKGRLVHVRRAADRRARFTFVELCDQPLGAADYRAIARHFELVMVTGVPRIAPGERNKAKRFITLVDVLYDAGRALVLTADGEPADLYMAKEGNEAFEFARTASRLVEMRTETWLRRAANPPVKHSPQGSMTQASPTA
ncbi:cell division protein ZapE [Pleomorphomonas sp. JP5]|uniref:cell division protein ZapE n=1 Tax=Pleomorphomonas sp. JP5 TaxID=2942998 RepID=UPI002044166A|nr:cell division protein ZapE [Pleomorphomonas sp. JP5]MCM5559666.1 cell division protein ZapE [Pleomorphomonas sp. JP5]